MKLRRRHRHRHRSQRGSATRTRNLVFVGGITAVLVIAVGLPILLSSPPPSPKPTPSTAQADVTLPFVPPLVPVAQLPTIAPGVVIPTEPAVPRDFPKPPPATAGPGVPATQIRIPSLSIDLPIVEGDGVDVPMNQAAHYPGSAWPGGGTNIYLYAHAREGMFLNLWSARVGDQVYLDLANGTTREYVVDKVDPDVPWDDVALLDPTGTEQLTLQTCVTASATGPRFVVFAHPVS